MVTVRGSCDSLEGARASWSTWEPALPACRTRLCAFSLLALRCCARTAYLRAGATLLRKPLGAQARGGVPRADLRKRPRSNPSLFAMQA